MMTYTLAVVTGTGDIDVSSGSSTATVVVTADDESTTQTYTIESTVATGIAPELVSNINIYYNSSDDLIQLRNSAEVERVEIYSITGRLQKVVRTHNQESVQISTSKVDRGLFLVRMKLTENRSQTAKFVK